MKKKDLKKIDLDRTEKFRKMCTELSRNKDFQILICLILLGCVVYRGWFRPGIIGRGDWIAKSKEFMLEELSTPSAWKTSEFGGYQTTYIGRLARYPILLIQSLIVYSTDADFGVTERILWFFPFIVLSISSMYLLSKHLFKERVAAAIASFAYLVNNTIIFRMHSGHLGIGMAYALAPLVIFFFIKSIEKSSIKDAVLCGAVLSLSMYYEIRISFLTACFLASYLIFQLLNRKTRTSFRILFIIMSVTVSLHIFWILPSFLSGVGFSIPSSYSSPIYLNLFSRTTFLQTLTLSIGYRPDQIFWPSTFILAGLVFSSVFLRKESIVKYLIVMDVIFAFLAKGTMAPFGEINTWIFQNIPLFVAFRLPIKFMYTQAIPHSLLLGITTSVISKKSKKNSYSIIPFCVIILILVSIWPAIFATGENIFVQGKELGTVGPLEKSPRGSTFRPSIPEGYFELNKLINEQTPDFRTLWIYTDPTFSTYNEEHPAFYPDLFSQSFYGFGYYFLKNIMMEKRGFGLEKVLGLANIGYVAFLPKDDTQWSWQAQKGYDFFVDIADSLKSLRRINTNENMRLYENEYKVDRIYSPKKTMLIVGGRSALLSLSTFNFSLADWTLLFLDQLKHTSLDYWDQLDIVVFKDKNIEDLIMATLEPEYKIDLWNYGKIPSKGTNPNTWNDQETDWIKTFAHYWTDRKGEIFESSGGLLETRAENATISFNYVLNEESEYEIWIRLAVGHGVWTLGHSKINVQINNVSFNISSYSPTEAGLYWKKLGGINLTSGTHLINIVNVEGPSVVDALIIVPKEKERQHSDKIMQLLKTKKCIFTYEAETRISDFEKYMVISEKRGLETTEGLSLVNKKEPTILFAFDKDNETAYLGKRILNPNEWNYIEENISISNFTKIRVYLYEVSAGEALRYYFSNMELYGERNLSLTDQEKEIEAWYTDKSPSVSNPELSSNSISGNYSMKVDILSDGVESYGEVMRNITPGNYSKISFWIYPEYTQYSKEKTRFKIIDDFESNYSTWLTDGAPSIGKPEITGKSIEGKQSMKVDILSDGVESYGEVMRNITPGNYSKISFWIYPEYSGVNKTLIQPAIKLRNETTYLGVKELTPNQWNYMLLENPPINKTENASFVIYIYEVSAGENLTYYVDNLRFEENPLSTVPITIDLNVPLGTYKTALRIAGEDSIGSMLISADGFFEYLNPNKEIPEMFTWKESKQFSVKDLSKPITIMMSSVGPIYLDSVIVYTAEPNETLSDLFLSEQNNLSFKRISSSEYEINGAIDNPSFIVFSESFDPRWEITYDNTAVQPIIATSAVNAFLVNRTGNLTLKLKYTPQTFVDLGAQLWIISLVSVVAFLVRRSIKEVKK